MSHPFGCGFFLGFFAFVSREDAKRDRLEQILFIYCQLKLKSWFIGIVWGIIRANYTVRSL